MTLDSTAAGQIMVDAGTDTIAVPISAVTGTSSAIVYIGDGGSAFPDGTTYLGLCYVVTVPAGFGTFVQATTGNTAPVNGEADWYTIDNGVYPESDNMWDYETITSMPTLMGFFSSGSWHEECPDLVTTVTGLNPTQTYRLYVWYDPCWMVGGQIQAGLSDASLWSGPSSCLPNSAGYWTCLPSAFPNAPDTLTGYVGVYWDMMHPVVNPPECGFVLVGYVGDVSGSNALNLYIGDGHYGFGSVARYIGLSYEVDTTAQVDYSDDVTVGGDLGSITSGGVVPSNWANANWKPFNSVYAGNPYNIGPGSQWAAKWGAGGAKVYVAAMMNDTATPWFTNTYGTAFGQSDNIEFFLNAGSNNGDFTPDQEPAQQYEIGIMDSARNQVWTNCGYVPAYTPSSSELEAAGKQVGNWLYYEAAMTPFQYFGGRVDALDSAGTPDVPEVLQAGDIIGLDSDVVGNDDGTYTGQKTSGYEAWGLSENYQQFCQQKLVRSGVVGTIT